MLSALFHRLRYAPIVPGTLLYRVVFGAGRLATRLGLLAPDTRIEVIEREDWLLVLTPLAGSSSIRECSEDIRRMNLRHCRADPSKRIFVMDRPYAARMRSFYNKKVRNPTNVAKALLLATCPPLTHRTTPEAFVEQVHRMIHRVDKDKHLYTIEQVCGALGRGLGDVRLMRIDRDRIELESMLRTDLSRVVNSSEDVAHYAEPLDLPVNAFDGVAEALR